MSPIDTVFTATLFFIAVVGLHGAFTHARQDIGYGRWVKANPSDPVCPVIQGWQRDERFRVALKLLLTLIAIGLGALSAGGYYSNEWPALLLRIMDLLAVGGAVTVLTVWRITSEAERRRRYPDIAGSGAEE